MENSGCNLNLKNPQSGNTDTKFVSEVSLLLLKNSKKDNGMQLAEKEWNRTVFTFVHIHKKKKK